MCFNANGGYKLKVILSIFILLFTINTNATSKDFPQLKIASQEVSPNHRVEIESLFIEDTLNSEKIVEWSSKSLTESEKSTIQIILAENEKNNQEIELFLAKLKIKLGLIKNSRTKKINEYRVRVNAQAKKLAGDGKKFFEKHERISLSVLRTVVNGSTVSAGLIINGGISPEAGIAIGFFSGSLSGLFQYFNAKFQSFIDGNNSRNQEVIKNKKYGQIQVKTTQMSKWFFTEVSLYAVIKTFSAAVGVPTNGFSAEAISVLKSSVLATGSQGLWDSTIATETKSELRNADGKPTEQAKIQMKSNVKTFVVSMASVFGGVMSLMGSNVGTWSLGALGISGGIYTYFSWKKRRSTVNLNASISLANCRSLFGI